MRKRRPNRIRRAGGQGGGRPGGRKRSLEVPLELLFIERAERSEPVVVEVDRPQAFRPRLVGFWRGKEFYIITGVVAVRREHDVTYHRVVTDRGAFDLRYVRRIHPTTLRARRVWELCSELDTVPIARLG